MNVSRRWFIGGLASFGAFGGTRFLCARDFRMGGTPNLRFGVVSDVHITKVGEGEDMSAIGNNLTFRHALEWFRAQGVDAVMIAGDMADYGMVEQLEAVAQAWYAVFPDDRHPNGRPVEKVFVYGNHDWDGSFYGRYAEKHFPDKTERSRHVLRLDCGGWWEKIFHEPYAPIYKKEVKGYSFIGSHWTAPTTEQNRNKGYRAFDRIVSFMAEHGRELDPGLPFFYVQHPHPKDTCYGSWAWGHDSGDVTKCLSDYPNAIAFSGHSHYSLTDERSIWQGAFTSIGAGSLRYTGMPYDAHRPAGYENTSTDVKDSWRYNAVKLMPDFDAGDCRQGMLWSVYDDCIVVKRREFLSDLYIGEDWVLPLPVAESRPFSFVERAKRFDAPHFAADSRIEISKNRVKNRRGEEKDAYRVVVPAVVDDNKARLYDLVFIAESKGGARKKRKIVMAEGFNHALGHARTKVSNSCFFALDELPKGEIRFRVIPRNCFGREGPPLMSEWI